MIATTSTLSPPSSASLSAAPARVLRVSREVENIGARVPMSKKRVTWRLVFADSQQVHTIMLEHSRITAKKRLRLDGRRLFTSEQYCAGDWRYDFQVSKEHATTFTVAIQDVKSALTDERGLDSIYELFVGSCAWEQLEERNLPARPRNGSSVWSSELYARRVGDAVRVLSRSGDEHNNNAVTAKCVSWTFAFGLHGTIHKLELRDLDRGDSGEFVVILDSRLLARVNHDDIDEDFWEYEYSLFGQHELGIVVTLEGDGKKYEFFVDGCAWKDLPETDFVLQTGWFPVFSRSRGTSYFRNESSGVSQWERPIMSRNGVAIDVPRRLSTQNVPPPCESFDADGLVRNSTGAGDNQALESSTPIAPLFASRFALSASDAAKHDRINLLDFSEIAVHASPTAQTQAALAGYDPFAQLHHSKVPPTSNQQQQTRRDSAYYQPPVDFLS